MVRRQARRALGSWIVSSMTTRSNTMFSGAFPDTEKAEMVLGFEAATTLDEMLDEVISWIDEAVKASTI
jgi:nucleoside-diphosphate-sugar epimerase